MGATVVGDAVNFAISASLGTKCELILYKKNSAQESLRIPFENAQRIGTVYAMTISGFDYHEYDYNFSIDGNIVTDEYAKALNGKKIEGLGKMVGGDFALNFLTEEIVAYEQTFVITSYD